MTDAVSPTLLTPENSLVLIIDYQADVLDPIKSHDTAMIALNARALAHAASAMEVPLILTTIGQTLRGDPPTLPTIRGEIPDAPELDRDTMNSWEDPAFRAAVEKSGRRKLIFAGIWTEVCLLYPVLHAQREDYETYFVVDAVGGSSKLAHDTAVMRMIQAGSQPITLNSLITEWVRDWRRSPHAEQAKAHLDWYAPLLAQIGSHSPKQALQALAA